jgi:hypothetical protein
MLKLYNGRFESILNPDRVFVKDSLEGGKSVVVAKYFGVSPSGELRGVSEEAVRISYPWLGSLKGFLFDSGERILNLLNDYISKIKDDGLSDEEFAESFNRDLGYEVSKEQLKHFHSVVKRSSEETRSVEDLKKLLFELEGELDNLMGEIKNGIALEEVVDRVKLEGIVEGAIETFKERIFKTYGVRNVEELLTVKVLPFP